MKNARSAALAFLFAALVIGAVNQNTTYAMRFCLPPGSPLKVEWPHGRPELARVEPAK